MAYGRRDHPRIRGEHAVGVGHARTLDGSSPHTRGAPFGVHAHTQRAGIIPAYAGSTSTACVVSIAFPDHPRIRGEHSRAFRRRATDDGSSPHTRGAPRQLGRRWALLGIIPAYAGSTTILVSLSFREWDHPRIRGEHDDPHDTRILDEGSSPHTRGAPRLPQAYPPYMSIIPAYAGSTGRAGSPGEAKADHPRIRGEHKSEANRSLRAQGSSPHTRGAR